MIIRRVASEAVFAQSRMGKATLCQGDQLFAGLNCFLPGQQHALHTHADQDKLYLVLAGKAEVTVGDRTDQVGEGDLVLAESGQPHGIANTGTGRLIVLTVMAPPPKPKPGP